MATQTKKKLDQQLREVLAQQLIEKQAKLTEAEAENRKLKNEMEKMQANFDKKEQQLEKNLEELQKKLNEMEHQQNEQQKNVIIGELEGQQNDQKHQGEKERNATSNQFSKMQNEQKIPFEKISELMKELKSRKILSNFRQNFWDATICHKDIEIIGAKRLTVHCKGKHSYGWPSVFAKYSILLNKNSSDIFYYEITVRNKKIWVFFGFALKQQAKLDGIIRYENGTYAYESDGEIWINGKGKGRNPEYSYGVGDTVGIGVNLATRRIIFTKNGLRLDFSDFFVSPSFADNSFHPFVSLPDTCDKIETNFGPNFKLNLATL
ncbi:hypothetical protein niasHT_002388 [Heterodera trifolii]|uniref:B30.2/SPRY domain-containing protein n=1 Tax=Heterodera trifolii TaxID=157864 RepID=A0ABD2LNR0_9BILA